MPFSKLPRGSSQIAILLTTLAGAAAGGLAGLLAADAVPDPPPVSQYAPAAALLAQVAYYEERLGKSLTGSSYTEATQTRVAKDASTLVVLFMALGMHDEQNPLAAPAPRLIRLATGLVAAAGDQAAAAGVFRDLQAAKQAGEGAAGDTPPRWEPEHYKLELLMKQVSTVNNRLKRNTRRESVLKRRTEDATGQAALLAVIAQAALVDTSAVPDASQQADWYGYAAHTRDAAGAVGRNIAGAASFADVTQSMKVLQESCEACHKAFRIETK